MSVSNITVKCKGGFLWNVQDRSAMTQGTTWNIWGILGLTLGYMIHFSISWVHVCWQYRRIMDGWIFMKISEYGHKEQQATLLYAWIDCFTLLKLGAVEVWAFGVLLVHFGMHAHEFRFHRCTRNVNPTAHLLFKSRFPKMDQHNPKISHTHTPYMKVSTLYLIIRGLQLFVQS